VLGDQRAQAERASAEDVDHEGERRVSDAPVGPFVADQEIRTERRRLPEDPEPGERIRQEEPVHASEEEEEQEEVEETEEEEEEEEEEEQEEDDDDEEEKEEKQKVAEKIHQKNIASKAPIIKEDKGGKEKPAAPKEKRTPPPRKTGSYTRIDAVCDALKTKKPKTVKDWVKATNEVYIEKGGSANDSESSMMIKYASKVMTHFDVKFPTE